MAHTLYGPGVGDNLLFLKKLSRKDDDEDAELMKKFGVGEESRKGGKKGNKPSAVAVALGLEKAPDNNEQYGTGIVTHKKKKKGGHYVNLFDEDGEENVVKLPGRHKCECQARKHRLVNNCTKCGRIVCEQEGSGPCFFCGSLVCTNEEEEILARGSKKSGELRRQLQSASTTRGEKESGQGGMSLADIGDSLANTHLNQAVSDRDRLIGYDRDKIRRTKVIDDQSDYLQDSANPWLPKQERDRLGEKQQEILEAMNKSRIERLAKFTLDFTGRQVLVEDDADVNKLIREMNEPDTKEKNEQDSRLFAEGIKTIVQESDDYQFPVSSTALIQPEYDESLSRMPHLTKYNKPNEKVSMLKRIQDSHFQEQKDNGLCLTLRQPFASLLVAGVKRHEGRGWYTDHRGPLWISSGGKAVTQHEVREIEQFYDRIYNGNPPASYPIQYPAGCLLGRVFVVDCLTQEEYFEQYPQGECDDPYVLICENPKECSVKFPIRGQSKFFPLDTNIHKAAKGLLQSF